MAAGRGREAHVASGRERRERDARQAEEGAAETEIVPAHGERRHHGAERVRAALEPGEVVVQPRVVHMGIVQQRHVGHVPLVQREHLPFRRVPRGALQRQVGPGDARRRRIGWIGRRLRGHRPPRVVGQLQRAPALLARRAEAHADHRQRTPAGVVPLVDQDGQAQQHAPARDQAEVLGQHLGYLVGPGAQLAVGPDRAVRGAQGRTVRAERLGRPVDQLGTGVDPVRVAQFRRAELDRRPLRRRRQVVAGERIAVGRWRQRHRRAGRGRRGLGHLDTSPSMRPGSGRVVQAERIMPSWATVARGRRSRVKKRPVPRPRPASALAACWT